MSIIICKECGKEISDKTKKCIHCGYKIKNKKSKENKVLLKLKKTPLFIKLLVIGFILMILIGGSIIIVNQRKKEIENDRKIKEANLLKEEEQNAVQAITDKYSEIIAVSDSINEIETEADNKIFNGGWYYSNVSNLKEEWLQIMNLYKKSVEDEFQLVIEIENLCINRMNSYCGLSKIEYETDYNRFVGNLKYFSVIIDDYNKWAKEYNKSAYHNGESVKYFDSYNASGYEDYIDYDLDGTYIAKQAMEEWINSFKPFKP